jgi:hypothetical protein
MECPLAEPDSGVACSGDGGWEATDQLNRHDHPPFSAVLLMILALAD